MNIQIFRYNIKILLKKLNNNSRLSEITICFFIFFFEHYRKIIIKIALLHINNIQNEKKI